MIYCSVIAASIGAKKYASVPVTFKRDWFDFTLFPRTLVVFVFHAVITMVMVCMMQKVVASLFLRSDKTLHTYKYIQ